MKLTGKCKEEFEKWLSEHWVKFESDGAGFYMEYKEMFYQTPFSMQYGIYVDFFDSVGVEVVCFLMNGEYNWFIEGDIEDNFTKTRHEARTKAIEKANEIYNEKQVVH